MSSSDADTVLYNPEDDSDETVIDLTISSDDEEVIDLTISSDDEEYELLESEAEEGLYLLQLKRRTLIW